MNTLKTYWKKFSQKSWTYKIAIVFVLGSLLVAVFADLIANDKPLFCICEGQWRWPAFRHYLESMGWVNISHAFEYTACTKKWMPLIPFAASTIDPTASGYLSPSAAWSFNGNKHWLGTDALGRDILAGLIHGTRYSWVIGLLSTALAAIPGTLLGMSIGYWRNHKLKLTAFQIVSLLGAFIFFGYELFILLKISSGFLGYLITLVWIILGYLLCRWIIMRGNLLSKKYNIPVDGMVMRFIDYFESFPRLFLLMALLVFMARPSMSLLVILIAFIRWPLFAQVARSETLRESALNYVLSTENLGIAWYKILTRHIWPNIRSSLYITALFSMSTAILLEASLSFIGLGLKLERVTWGSMLNEGRQYLPGWWLSLFPGLAIFCLLISLHWILAEKDKSDGHREGW